MREFENPQGRAKRKRASSSRNRGQNHALGSGVGEARAVELESGDLDESEQEPNDSGQNLDAVFELENARSKRGFGVNARLKRNDVCDTATNPAESGGAWNSELRKEVRLPGEDDLLPNPVVVGAARGGHGGTRPQG